MKNTQVEIQKGSRKPLGVYLVEAGLISQAQLDTALKEQQTSKTRLGEALAQRGWVQQQTIEYLIDMVILPERQLVENRLPYLDKSDSQDLSSVYLQPEDVDLLPWNVPLRQMQVRLYPRKTLKFLLSVITAIAFLGLFSKFTQYYLPDYPLRDLFVHLTNLNGEQNIPALYSCSALLFSSLLLAIIAHAKQLAGERYLNHWRALSVIFLYLSVDEALSLHEIVMYNMRSVVRTTGFLYYAWVIPAGVLVIICLLAFWRFLVHLPAQIRSLILLAGCLYVGGALGFEMVAGYYESLYGTDHMAWDIMLACEEFLEMLGNIVFIYALLSYISIYMKGVALHTLIYEQKMQRHKL